MQNTSGDIGLIGLAVMGQNLVLNMNDHGYRVAVFNRTVSKVADFLNSASKGPQGSAQTWFQGGDPVDTMIDSLLPHLEKAELIIDGPGSHYPRLHRRTKTHADQGILV